MSRGERWKEHACVCKQRWKMSREKQRIDKKSANGGCGDLWGRAREQEKIFKNLREKENKVRRKSLKTEKKE